MMNKKLISLLIFISLIQACSPSSPTPLPTEAPANVTEVPLQGTASRLEELGAYQCPDSDFTCINVTVPLNHFDAQNERMIEVVFAVLPASGERKGMFVTSIGGPGGSGLLSADSYTSYFDPRIPENFDIVFFDQRGVNLSNGLYCAQAATDYYRTDTDANSPEGEQHLLNVTKTFVDNCIAEMSNSELIPYLDTIQAIEDLEVFRGLIGDDQFWLYGESYGTQFAQTYATVHPEHVAGLILDGVVDLTLTDIEFQQGQATAFNDVLVATLKACDADAVCAEDMGGDAVAIYDNLAAQLKQSPKSFEFPLSTGEVEQREFTFTDLESAASGFIYSETPRMMFLRSLMAYARDGTLVPLARILYSSLVINPDTLTPIDDLSYSDAVYYGVTCGDYAEPGTTADEQAANFIKAGDEIDTNVPRLSSVFYGDLPCAYWPYPQEDDKRPEPFTGEGFTTFVLNSTTDPATPYSNSESVYSHLSDGYFITEIGGPHVIFGWGIECVDNVVTEFLVNDTLPTEREITCEGRVADEVVSVAPADAANYENPLEAFKALDDEIYYLPEYYYWDYATPTTVGCTYGGTISFESTDNGELFTLESCAFSNGFSVTGSGTNNYDDSSFTLEVDVTGLADGTLTYTRSGEGVYQVTGTYGGVEIDISE
ncbi:MAG: alpha/beta fold hydrolase [Anaerolineales bacterium]|nr:alpha/beta fold hydrolase [Anaerolineales bacterium]